MTAVSEGRLHGRPLILHKERATLCRIVPETVLSTSKVNRQDKTRQVIVIVLSVAHRRPRTESLLVNQGESLEHALNGGPSGAEALPGRLGGVK